MIAASNICVPLLSFFFLKSLQSFPIRFRYPSIHLSLSSFPLSVEGYLIMFLSICVSYLGFHRMCYSSTRSSSFMTAPSVIYCNRHVLVILNVVFISWETKATIMLVIYAPVFGATLGLDFGYYGLFCSNKSKFVIFLLSLEILIMIRPIHQ